MNKATPCAQSAGRLFSLSALAVAALTLLSWPMAVPAAVLALIARRRGEPIAGPALACVATAAALGLVLAFVRHGNVWSY